MFFDEAQFESYRALGKYIARKCFGNEPTDSMTDRDKDESPGDNFDAAEWPKAAPLGNPAHRSSGATKSGTPSVTEQFGPVASTASPSSSPMPSWSSSKADRNPVGLLQSLGQMNQPSTLLAALLGSAVAGGTATAILKDKEVHLAKDTVVSLSEGSRSVTLADNKVVLAPDSREVTLADKNITVSVDLKIESAAIAKTINEVLDELEKPFATTTPASAKTVALAQSPKVGSTIDRIRKLLAQSGVLDSSGDRFYFGGSPDTYQGRDVTVKIPSIDDLRSAAGELSKSSNKLSNATDNISKLVDGVRDLKEALAGSGAPPPDVTLGRLGEIEKKLGALERALWQAAPNNLLRGN